MTSLVGTGVLLRFNLRRDRLMIPVWVAVNALMVLSMPNTLKGMYGTAAERADLLDQVATNSSFRALIGPVFGDSLGALTAWRVGVYAGALAAVTGLLVVVRHTRDEEESGRQELISSGVVGRRASLTAALLAAGVASGVLALLVTAGLAGQGAVGALAFGLGLAAVGMLFATAAAVVAQLTESARLARGLTAGVLGAAFVLRAAGDSASTDGSSALTWLSPLGWLSQLRPSPANAGGCCCCSRRRSRARARWPTSWRAAGTWAWASSRPAPGPRPAAWARRERWPGGSSGAACSAGRSASSSPGWSTAV